MSGDNRLRGITCPDMTRVVREALAGGWEWMGHSGTTHAQIRWPATGDVLRFGTTPSVASWKSLATNIERVSGVKVWRKGNKRRSRKAPTLSGFNLSAARRESSQWHESETGTERDRLAGERAVAIAECRSLAKSGRREDLLRLPDLWRRIAAIEDELERRFYEVVERFDPTSLGGAR